MMKELLIIISLGTVILFFSSCSSREILISDFDGSSYDRWATEGEAFGTSPLKTTGSGEGQNVVVQGGYGKTGDGYVGTTLTNPELTGTLTSPIFLAERRFLVFLMSGSNYPDSLCVNLLQNGEVVQTKTGDNERFLAWSFFDLKDLKGKNIQIQIVDNVVGQRSRLQVDYFYLTNVLPMVEKSIELKINKKYINLPVRTGNPRKRVTLTIDGEYYDEFMIELADSSPEYYVFVDVEKFLGKKARLYTSSIERTSNAFEFISIDEEIKDSENLYSEPLRQQFHFSSKRGWNNDPNGLVYYDGEYHLFYQHNPYGWNSGQKHWGHAVSTDLVHWQELPEAINPREYGDWVFSGSAIMDPENTSGFKSGEEDVMIIAYTSTGRGEVIAYSNDKGRIITEYDGNPVVVHSGRDPKLIWYEPGQHWVMAVYHQEDNKRWIAFYTSVNLKEWTFQSKNEDFFECPEIFELAIDGDPARTKWIIYEADGRYQIGDFDGKTFTPETGKIPNNFGNCFYASQTFNNIPVKDGRRIQIGWGRGVNTPGMPFNQCMLFPTSLTLRNTDRGIRMLTEPVKEIELLHKTELKLENQIIEPGIYPSLNVTGELYHIKGEFQVGKNSVFGLKIHGAEIVYDAMKQELSCMDNTASLSQEDGKIYMEILVDRNTIEIFCNHGEVYMPVARDLSKEYGFEFICNNGMVTAESFQLFELHSIWL